MDTVPFPGGGGPNTPLQNCLFARQRRTITHLSELLAEATGTTPEAIERGAEKLEIAPCEGATVVDE